MYSASQTRTVVPDGFFRRVIEKPEERFFLPFNLKSDGESMKRLSSPADTSLELKGKLYQRSIYPKALEISKGKRLSSPSSWTRSNNILRFVMS